MSSGSTPVSASTAAHSKIAATHLPSSPSVKDAEVDAHRQIEKEVQQLLSEMQSTFKSFSDNVFTQIDQMEAKISELDSTLKSLGNHAQMSSSEISNDGVAVLGSQ
ncbi:hypothetical protein BWQ96_09871 [Gracilariopsis chorda]|uniref:Heat shock factor-binding protein 1 n=1 Tax=Gracilariopsis chorda TaxID=448386 RepID=A0A2V3IED4_9FLOR|nr:hypothetical protein BWQ96_09871 [Gracilariopsis chorda]|eukprot:PXF40411.1 hypothetical protein BWQ96_09871 [Gracilariopsis chorda]